MSGLSGKNCLNPRLCGFPSRVRVVALVLTITHRVGAWIAVTLVRGSMGLILAMESPGSGWDCPSKDPDRLPEQELGRWHCFLTGYLV